jgi:acyl-CoA thioester hydrolase
MPPPAPFTLAVRVGPDDIDALRHVNNVAFLRYVQDAAAAHWLALAPAEWHATIAWVVRRHEIEYLRPAFEGDDLTVATWVGEPTAATWERFTEVRRGGDVLVSARTVWVQVDAATGRPRRIDPRMTERFARAES